jgi:hypothetical protein
LKLKASQIPETRKALLANQQGLCGICGLHIVDDPVLDHDHKTGAIRSVAHRGCNSAEGRVLGILKRSGIKEPRMFLTSLVRYLETHDVDQHNLIHPTFRTADEKKAFLKKRTLKRKQLKISKGV